MMLKVLRDAVLGEERLIQPQGICKSLGFQTSHPMDFFHTMENVSGEDLSWFWKSWIFNNWKFDQAVKGVNMWAVSLPMAQK
jgi:hypothetical protein